jgi:hypothetical protein
VGSPGNRGGSRGMGGNLAQLHQWARLGRAYAPRRLAPNWSAVNRLIVVAEPYFLEEAATLGSLLREWSGRFRMQDPFLSDLGVHRWLGRETSYSDWLAWVLERLEPAAVFEVLGVPAPLNPGGTGKCHVRRESQLGARYIDMLIHFDRLPDYAIGVEVKKYDEQYSKQSEYLEELREKFCNPTCILIAIPEDIDKGDLCGFTLRSWRKVAFALRRRIAEYAGNAGEDNRIVTAMMLGFVGAVEQNLLGFGASAPRRVSKGEPTLIPGSLVKYLKGEDER